MSTAFVLSGGGSLGAVQVGMLQALAEAGVHPDLLVGTSAGAINAAWVGMHGMSADSLERLADVWAGLRRGDLFPVRPRQVLLGLVGGDRGLVSAEHLRSQISRHVHVDLLEGTEIPVHVLATDLLTGETVTLSRGSLVRAVLASSAIPGLLPPVAHDGRLLVDGGIGRHDGVTAALALGARTVYVLPAGSACALAQPPRSAVGVAMHALTLLIQRHLEVEVTALQAEVAIKLLPPLCPLSVAATDFTQARLLVRRGHAATSRWLRERSVDLPDPQRFLATHRHPHVHAEGTPVRIGVDEA